MSTTQSQPIDDQADEAIATAIEQLSAGPLELKEKRAALAQIAAGLRGRGFKDIFRPKAAMDWLADAVVSVAPRIPLRDAATLRVHFPGMSDMQIATRLVRNASRATAGIGAVGGGVSAIQWVATPTLLTTPVLLAAETLAVVAVEIKLIGELQELYGQPVAAGPAQKALTLLQAWAGRRGVNLLLPSIGASTVLGTAARKELRDRLVGRFGRNLSTLGPLFTGAAIAALLNRRATNKLAGEVRRDLLGRVPRQITR